jgi:predicted nucleotidyltransferase
MHDALNQILSRAKDDDEILAIVIYGSFARGEEYHDIDVCLVVWPNRLENVNTLEKEISYSSDNLDIHIFQNLPLYIQAKVLEEGIVKLVKDDDEYFDLVLNTIQKWEDFKPSFTLYLEEVMSGPKDTH